MEFANLIGYDAYGLGNHDFDDGVEGIVPFIDGVDFPVLASNLVSMNTHMVDNSAKLNLNLTNGANQCGLGKSSFHFFLNYTKFYAINCKPLRLY